MPDGRTFVTKYKENLHSYRHKPTESSFTQNQLDKRHFMGSVEKKIKILHIANNRLYIDILEDFASLVKLKIEPNKQPKQKPVIKCLTSSPSSQSLRIPFSSLSAS
jgi:hypothetical protein